MHTNPYQASSLEHDAGAAVLSDREYDDPTDTISSWRVLGAFLLSYLATQATFVLASAVYLAIYPSFDGPHDSGLEYTIGHMIGHTLALVLFGTVFTCIPILFFAVVLNVVIFFVVRRSWLPWIPYVVSVSLTSLVFVGILCVFPQSIPDTAFSFADSVKNVSRPGLCMNEIPLLMIALMAGLLGTWLSLRTLRGGQAQP